MRILRWIAPLAALGLLAVMLGQASAQDFYGANDAYVPASSANINMNTMLDRIEATWTVDHDRIYATGFSNGGSFTDSRLLMEMPDVFAAFATWPQATTPQSSPVLDLHIE